MEDKSLKDSVVCQQVKMQRENTLIDCSRLLKKSIGYQQVKNISKITFWWRVEIINAFSTLLVDLLREWKLLRNFVNLSVTLCLRFRLQSINIAQRFVYITYFQSQFSVNASTPSTENFAVRDLILESGVESFLIMTRLLLNTRGSVRNFN